MPSGIAALSNAFSYGDTQVEMLLRICAGSLGNREFIADILGSPAAPALAICVFVRVWLLKEAVQSPRERRTLTNSLW